MSKFDLNLKIKPQDLTSEIYSSSSKKPDELLRKLIGFSSRLKPYYFNWGRNALYYLFQSLPFTTVTFPAFTCPTLTEAAQKAGKKVVLIEVDLNTFNLDIEKIPPETKCLVVVHTFGNPVDIKKIRKKLGSKVFIIEDCAHALFSQLRGKYVGSQGNAILFSLYKQIANINGSVLMSQDKLIDQQAEEGVLKYCYRLLIKTAGWHQWILDLKRKNYLPKIEKQKLTDFKPSHLVFHLFNKGFKNLAQEVKMRRKIAQWYWQQVKKSSLIEAQHPEENSLSSYYQFALRLHSSLVGKRNKIVLGLRKKGIIIDRLWYRAPVIQLKYQKFQKKCPQALLLAKTVINLPIDSNYNRSDVEQLFKHLNQTILEAGNL